MQYYFLLMGYAYITDQQGLYFFTLTTKDWVDTFTRNDYRKIITDSLEHCIREKGLEIYAWVLMSNHLHMITASSKEDLSGILRDFKKYTSTKIIEAIDSNAKESRKGNHPVEIRTEAFYQQKMQYIHQNPVRAGWVRNEEDYEWSSAGYFYKKQTAVTLSFYNG